MSTSGEVCSDGKRRSPFDVNSNLQASEDEPYPTLVTFAFHVTMPASDLRTRPSLVRVRSKGNIVRV